MWPRISPKTTSAYSGNSNQRESFDSASQRDATSMCSIPYRTLESHLCRLGVPKTRELVGKPRLVLHLLEDLNSAPDRALFSRRIRDSYNYSPSLCTMFIEQPYDQAMQPSFISLCLNAFFLKQKSDIDIFIPSFHHVPEGSRSELKVCIDTVAQNLLLKLGKNQSIAVLMPSDFGNESEYAHVSTLIFRKESGLVSCIVYDSVMTIQSPTVQLFEAILAQSDIDTIDVFVANGLSQADNFSCRTKSLVESSVALRFPNPMLNIGELEPLPEFWRHRNAMLSDLLTREKGIRLYYFQRNMYPDKTAQISHYHDQHMKVREKPIGFDTTKTLQAHTDQYSLKVFVSSVPIENGKSERRGSISFEKTMNLYLKLKSIQVSCRAKGILESVKQEYGDHYRDVVDRIVRYHSLQTAPLHAFTHKEMSLPNSPESDVNWCGP